MYLQSFKRDRQLVQLVEYIQDLKSKEYSRSANMIIKMFLSQYSACIKNQYPSQEFYVIKNQFNHATVC